MIISLANMSCVEQLREVQELREHGRFICTNSCKTSDAYLLSLLGQDGMG